MASPPLLGGEVNTALRQPQRRPKHLRANELALPPATENIATRRNAPSQAHLKSYSSARGSRAWAPLLLDRTCICCSLR